MTDPTPEATATRGKPTREAMALEWMLRRMLAFDHETLEFEGKLALTLDAHVLAALKYLVRNDPTAHALAKLIRIEINEGCERAEDRITEIATRVVKAALDQHFKDSPHVSVALMNTIANERIAEHERRLHDDEKVNPCGNCGSVYHIDIDCNERIRDQPEHPKPAECCPRCNSERRDRHYFGCQTTQSQDQHEWHSTPASAAEPAASEEAEEAWAKWNDHRFANDGPTHVGYLAGYRSAKAEGKGGK